MEIWKQIPDHPAYWVSNLGNVESELSGRRKPLKQRIIKSGKRGGAYWGFKVRVGWLDKEDNVPKTTTVKTHRIVALLFIGPVPLDKPIVMHLDESKDNNRWDNLQYGTNKENCERYQSYLKNQF
jgi:hypothetical protein